MQTTGMKLLVMAVAFACMAAMVDAKTTTWTGGVDGKWSTAGNWSNGIPATGDTLAWDASSTANKITTNDLVGLSVASIIYTLAPAGVVLNGNPLATTGTRSLDASFGSGTITVNLDLALPGSAILDENADTVINGVLSGASTSLQIGRGLHALYGLNTFSGPVTLCTGNGAGTYVVNSLKNSGQAQSLGTGSLIQFGAINDNDRGNLYYTGGTTSTDKGFQIGGAIKATGGVFANGSGALTWAGAQTVAMSAHVLKTFTLGGFNADANTWASTIGNNSSSGTIALAKSGRGTWILSGANSFTGGVTVTSGTLTLDYVNNATVVNSTNTLTLGGGTLEFKASSSGSTQVLGNVTASVGTGLSRLKASQNGGSGVAVTLGTVSVNTGYNGPSDVLFDLYGSTNSGFAIGMAIDPTPGASTVNGHLLIRTPAGQYDFAQNGNVIANPLQAVNATTPLTGAGNGSATTNYLFTASASVGAGGSGAAVSARSLRIVPSSNNQVMTIANVSTSSIAPASSAGLSVAGGGIVYDGGSYDFEIRGANAPTNFAVLRSNNSGGNEFSIHHFGSGKLTLASNVYVGRASTDSAAFNGTGLIDHQGGVAGTEASARAAFVIHGAVLRVSGTTDAIKLDTTATGVGCSPVILNGGGVLELVTGNLTRNVASGTSPGTVQWTGDGGFSAYNGNRAVNLQGGAALTWGSSGFVPSENALVLSSSYSDSMIDFQNVLNLGGLQRVVRVANGSAAVDARLSGVLSSGLTGGLVKEGDGTLELTATNTYAGETWIKAGTLSVNGTLGGNSGAGAGSALTVFSGGSLGGTGTLYLAAGKNVTVASGGTLAPGNAGVGTLTVNGPVTLAEGAVYQWDYQNGVGDCVALTGANGALTLPSVATVQVSQVSGELPSPAVLFTATTLAGATSLSGWTVNSPAGGKVRIQGASVVLEDGRMGTMLIVR